MATREQRFAGDRAPLTTKLLCWTGVWIILLPVDIREDARFSVYTKFTPLPEILEGGNMLTDSDMDQNPFTPVSASTCFATNYARVNQQGLKSALKLGKTVKSSQYRPFYGNTRTISKQLIKAPSLKVPQNIDWACRICHPEQHRGYFTKSLNVCVIKP